MTLHGTRRDIDEREWETADLGDYGKLTHDNGWHWYCRVPSSFLDNFGLCNLNKHEVVENADGTITVSPSILTWDGNGHEWHGFLERGEWREV